MKTCTFSSFVCWLFSELIVTYDNEPLEQVPRPTEVSVMCGMDTVTRREGHVGWRVEYESILGAPRSNGQGRGGNGGIAGADRAKAVSPFYRQVYFHSDILQARNLPAMDADASLNPWWTIEVETEVRLGGRGGGGGPALALLLSPSWTSSCF